MPCFALVEKCGLVFLELAAGLADSWHVSPPCKCFVPESDRRGWNALLSSWLCVQYGAMVGLGSDRWYLRFPPALTVELSKLDMKNGPTIFWLDHFILQTYDSIAF